MADSLPARIARKRDEVVRHKADIRKCRELLAAAATELAAMERDFSEECRRRGIKHVVMPVAGIAEPEGVGAIHGRDPRP